MAQELKKYDVKEIDCEKMLIHPSHPQLVNFLHKNIPQLKSIKIEEFKGFTRAMVYRYVLLMYDPESPISKMQSIDWFEKKYEACAYAGFELSKKKDGNYRFHEKVDEFIFGKNEKVVDVIALFLGWVNNFQWEYAVTMREAMLSFTRDSVGRKISGHKQTQDYLKIYNEFNATVEKLANVKEEPEDFKSRFYANIERSRLAVKPEEYAQSLAEGEEFISDNPYGVNYVVDKIKFVGDTLPDE